MILVAVCGACGRMGKLIIREVASQPDMRIVAAIDAPNTPAAGKDAGEIAGIGELGVRVVGADRLAEILRDKKPDVLVDFTTADAAAKNIRTAVGQGIPVVVGTTGFSKRQLEEISRAVKRAKVPAIISPNMSVGVNVFFNLVEDAAKLLGKDYNVDIIEAHHIHKADAPSGTAVRAAEIVAKELGLSPKDIKYGRPAGRRSRGGREIYIHSIRAGDVIGEHIVMFTGKNELVEITHRALGRETFAIGVTKAIRYVAEKGKAGVVQNMRDVLGLR